MSAGAKRRPGRFCTMQKFEKESKVLTVREGIRDA